MAKKEKEEVKEEIKEEIKEEPKKNPNVIYDPNEILAYDEKGKAGK